MSKPMTTNIAAVKAKVSMQEWRQRIQSYQNSGMSVKAWCRENGISTSRYYFHLRKIREAVPEENRIVPVESPAAPLSGGIQIQSGNIHITLSENVPTKQLTAILVALKQY